MSKKFSLWDKKLKEYNKRKNVKDKHYSSFWWDSDWSAGGSSRFGGMSDDMPSSSDVVKLIKLTNYQRAISNFVKIVTKQDIPVVFSGETSMTDGKRVILSSDISDKNFDVAVGLALHEGSHIKLTDFNALPNYFKQAGMSYTHERIFKNIVNVIEDRRIDDYIFKTSPGYKAYYHQMYSHYFDNAVIGKGLLSRKLRDSKNIEHYLFHITNMTNPVFDRNALPGLSEIMSIINLPNIGRLKSTADVLQVASQVFDKLIHTVNTNSNAQSDSEAGSEADSSKPSNGDDQTSDEPTDNQQESNELSSAELEKINAAYRKQEEFVNGQVNKKSTTKKLQGELEQVSKMGLDVQSVGDGHNTFQCIVYDLSKRSYFRRVFALCNEYESANAVDRPAIVDKINTVLSASIKFNKYSDDVTRQTEFPSFMWGRNRDLVLKGFELGSLLGRKLMIRNEERSLVHNRLVSGHIDQKRLSHAGYGIETVFKQIHIDRYKQACLHISLDLSSSMAGSRWKETVQMASAIVKAATYVQNLRIQVSLRTTTNGRRKDSPVLICLYDSKVNDLNHYVDTMSKMTPSGTTPEGLCYDALIRRNMLMPTTSECTSYFLNISDGFPGMSGWGGDVAINYTRKMVNKFKNDLGVNVLSFFVDDKDDSSEPHTMFRNMYGKDSRKVCYKNVTQIARELNAKFLSEGKYAA